MTTLDIRGTPVAFPFKPYDCQLDYISGVLEALDESKNALLESPTGTGKTLCLLTASLAWQQRNSTMVASQPTQPSSTQLAYEEPQVTDLSRPPKRPQQHKPAATAAMPSVIIYASRTHSQLGQVANELKNTVYRPRLSLLGSREQLCVHEEVSQMKGPAKNHACSALVQARRCKYHRGTEGMVERPGSGGAGGAVGGSVASDQSKVSDIEELVSMARQHEFCPFYLGRGQAPRAELVLMPYNYLLDPGTRRGIKINWNNAVVIFDEAHNLESVASDASSFELTSAQVAGAQEEALRCYKIYSEGGGDEEGGGAAQADNALLVKQALHLLEDAVENVDLPSGRNGLTRKGHFVYDLLGHAGITCDNAQAWLGKLQDMSDTLQENALYGQANALKMDVVARAIKVAFRGGNASRQECLEFSEMYRAHVAPADSVTPLDGRGGGKGGRGGKGGGVGMRGGAGGGGGGAGRVLCFWCFCPGVAMQDLKALGVRSIVVTSGTLSPLSSFANELRLPFEVQVENPHVIGPEQAWIGTLGRGPTSVALNSSYANRDNDDYKDELGATLANLCRIVPGGMLVFFSTYRTMNDCVQRWKHFSNGKAWARITAHKEPMIEPRTAADLKAVMEEYDAKIENSGGAVFLAVCRGKVSEGMDFSDSRARCVVVTGIPYAPAMDPKVVLKRKYMSESSLPPGVARVSGNDWYQQQASRAVNQAIGRVIRHRLDYGCVVLCDARFAEERNRKSLSLWARPFVRECSGFGKVAADLTKFFKACAANPDLKHTTATASTRSKPPTAASAPNRSGSALPGLSTTAASSSYARGRNSRLAGLAGADGSVAGAAQLSSLQDVGDIVESVGGPTGGSGGGAGGRNGGGSSGGDWGLLGGQHKAAGGGGNDVGGGDGAGGGAAPLGLLDALKASAKVVGGDQGAVAEHRSGSGVGSAAGRFGDAPGESGGGGGGRGGGWDSVPLSQRLAVAGGKTASGAVAPSAHGGNSSKQKQQQQQQQQQRGKEERQETQKLDARPRGLGAGRTVGSSEDNGGRRGSVAVKASASSAAGSSPATPKPRATEGRRARGDHDGRTNTESSVGGGAGGGSRRRELASVLVDLRKSVAPGAFEVFRSRARALKEEGVLDAPDTARDALKGVLEVLLLAPPELKLPQRFAPSIPNEHAAEYAALVARRCSGGAAAAPPSSSQQAGSSGPDRARSRSSNLYDGQDGDRQSKRALDGQKTGVRRRQEGGGDEGGGDRRRRGEDRGPPRSDGARGAGIVAKGAGREATGSGRNALGHVGVASRAGVAVARREGAGRKREGNGGALLRHGGGSGGGPPTGAPERKGDGEQGRRSQPRADSKARTAGPALADEGAETGAAASSTSKRARLMAVGGGGGGKTSPKPPVAVVAAAAAAARHRGAGKGGSPHSRRRGVERGAVAELLAAVGSPAAASKSQGVSGKARSSLGHERRHR